MDNETQTQEAPKQEEAPKVELSPIEKADKAIERLEAANKKAEEIVKRQEEIASRLLLGGHSISGQTERKTPQQEQSEKLDADVKAALARYK